MSRSPNPPVPARSGPPNAPIRSEHWLFDHPPEIFATDSGGAFVLPLERDGTSLIETKEFDEMRAVVSIWHPSEKHSIDLDRAYVELRLAFDEEDPHWVKIAELEPVVPPSNPGESFDGWIVLPVLGARTALRLCGSGFEPRSRLQIRASLYLVG